MDGCLGEERLRVRRGRLRFLVARDLQRQVERVRLWRVERILGAVSIRQMKVLFVAEGINELK